MTTAPLVVEVERSGLIESSHLVDVAVVDAGGRLTASAGDPGTVAYLRSSAKPVQAAACLGSGWLPAGVEQIAIACGSHNGEPEHLRAARVTLETAGVEEAALRCPAAWPSRPEDAAGAGAPSPIFHNCSGKHAAMLATATANGWPLDDYRDPDHPMQRAVSGLLERLAGRPAGTGVDGCGVPTFAFPLSGAAGLLLSLDGAAPRVLDAMRAEPFLVAGTGRLCTAVMTSAPAVAMKIGAEGLACGVIRDRGVGFALKTRDGTQRAREVATVAVLRMLGAVNDRVNDALALHADPPVTGGGARVGAVTVRGDLQRA